MRTTWLFLRTLETARRNSPSLEVNPWRAQRTAGNSRAGLSNSIKLPQLLRSWRRRNKKLKFWTDETDETFPVIFDSCEQKHEGPSRLSPYFPVSPYFIADSGKSVSISWM